MSLDKAIAHGKEKRKPYAGGSRKDVDPRCRNHGGCPDCRKRIKHKLARQAPAEEKDE